MRGVVGRENEFGGKGAERQQPEGVLLLFQMFHREEGTEGGEQKIYFWSWKERKKT